MTLHSMIGADLVQDWRVSRSGRIATDQKAVQTRGPGRVVLGSKPQLATAKELVRWAGEQAAACDYRKTRALGRGLNSSPQLATAKENSCAGLRALLAKKLVRWATRATAVTYALRRNWASSQSLRASPRKLKAKTARKIAKP